MNLSAREAEAALLQHRVPLFTERFLHVDCGPGVLCAIARNRCGAEATGLYLGDDAAELAAARSNAKNVIAANSQGSDASLQIEFDVLHSSGTLFDCIVFTPRSVGLIAALDDAVDRAAALLAPDGYIVVVRHASSERFPDGFARYSVWPYDCTLSELDEEFLPEPGELRVEVLVREGYDPIAHTQRLAAARRFDRAYEVLCAVPPARRADPAYDARLQTFKMVCLLGLQKLGGYPPLTALAAGLFLFSRIQRRLPNQPDTFRVLARYWGLAGDTGSADRYNALADELSGVVARPTEVRHCEESPTKQSPRPNTATFSSSQTPPPRVLFITGEPRVNYGLDILYHGLKRVLGEANATEFPFKPTLHGAPDEKFGHYPCLFNHEGAPLDAQQLLANLRAGHYDLIAWGDSELFLPKELAREIIAAANETPLAIIDMQDDCADHFGEVTAWLGLATPPACFKRERIRTATYSVDVHALPFAYADELVATDIDKARETPHFWAGQRGWSLRDVFLPAIEARGIDTRQSFTQDTYRAALRNALACLNLAGAGFDTVRYWEAPAQGCLLLSETLPISLPNDFQDMREALYFATLAELNDRLDYLNAHPEAIEQIRHAGWEKLRTHHTASARARQFLVHLECGRSAAALAP